MNPISAKDLMDLIHSVMVMLTPLMLAIKVRFPRWSIILQDFIFHKFIFITKFLKNANISKIFIINKLSDCSRHCKYLQLEKTSGFEVELPIQKHWQSVYSRVWQKGSPLALIGLMLVFRPPGRTKFLHLRLEKMWGISLSWFL